MVNQEDKYWDIVIEPKSSIWHLGVKDVWEKRYLLWLFIQRDLTVAYKQTIVGFAWYFISPIITTLIYMVVFGRIAGLPTDDIPQPLFYLSGLCLWNYFSVCLGRSATTLQAYAGIYSKVYFPRLIPPISVLISQLFRFTIQILLFIAVYVYYVANGLSIHPNWYALLFPVLIFMLAGMALGLGLIVSSLTVKYRDFSLLFGTIVSLWMYATPIVYPLSVVTNPFLYKCMTLNPITFIIEAFKYGAMGIGYFSWAGLAYCAALMCILLFLGIILFNHKQKYFIDTI